MKKYTILDAKGKKTIVYAKDIAHALPYAKDSKKIKDESITIEGDWNYEGIQAAKFMGLKFAYTGRRVNGYPEAKISGDKQKLIKYMKEWYDPDFFKEGFKGFDSKVKDANLSIIDKLIAEEEKAVMDYKEALMADSDSFANSVYTHILDEELDHLRELRSLKEQSALDGNTVEKKLDDSKIEDAELKESNSVYYKFERGYWHILSIHNAKEIDHEKVAALARNNRVIIEPYFRNDYHRTDTGGYYTDYRAKSKDKEGIIKFCETLNPIVKPLTLTDKKLDDSIHDGLSEAKELVEQAGFKVVRVYGTDNEPYITVDWNGSYSELQKKVRELKSKAKAIGYKTVYADDNDICFSKY